MNKSNKVLAGLALAGLLLSVSSYVFAADLRYTSDPKQQFLTVDQSDKVKNLYAGAKEVTVNATVGKDAVVAGAFVSVNGNVTDDLIAAGANLNIHGNVGGSARAWQEPRINIDSNIHDDLAVAGANIIISQNANIGGDLLASGAVVAVAGKVNGNIKMSGATLYIDGQVLGNINFVGQKLQLGPHADIKGNINYSSSMVYTRDDNAKVGGEVTYHQIATGNAFGFFTGFSLAVFLITLIAEILAGLFFVYMFKKAYADIVLAAGTNFWHNVLYGFLTMIAVPIAIVILFLSVVGYYLAIILVVSFVLMLLFAWLVGMTELGMKIQGLINRNTKPVLNYGTVAIAIFIVTVLRFVPILGPLMAVVLILCGLGTIIKKLKRRQD